ncbi:hypothetical protein [Aphanothece sacrum]|uniref:Hydrogenase 3 membrane subunit n=1 Tax=Aphanothece sacrum FPU1 TaxID=1920663 RepID=A0A401IJ59_APHSA|nr:hypothetical protein [Aphanothece sacrum]GBF81246.1 hydrogenase 3 membrane subunit [Aphanothece sacrum FPU1]GBF83404.1 hydrogenase 3 membrane subunit [Aphanothece sacrum FPU3]
MCTTIELPSPNFSDQLNSTNQISIDVHIGPVFNEQRVTKIAILDTGSPYTLVAKSILTDIGARQTGLRPARLNVAGNTFNAFAYAVRLHLAHHTHELTVREWPRRSENPLILIGRDILCRHSIMFDSLPLITITSSSPSYHIWNQES